MNVTLQGKLHLGKDTLAAINSEKLSSLSESIPLKDASEVTSVDTPRPSSPNDETDSAVSDREPSLREAYELGLDRSIKPSEELKESYARFESLREEL